MATVRRRALLAYLIGAAVAGTFLVLPYGMRALGTTIEPALMDTSVPIFLLPIAWGAWNCLWVVRRPHRDIGVWGAGLGAGLGVVLNLLVLAQGAWFTGMLAVPVGAGAIYFLGWYLIVGPLNEALGADDGTP